MNDLLNQKEKIQVSFNETRTNLNKQKLINMLRHERSYEDEDEEEEENNDNNNNINIENNSELFNQLRFKEDTFKDKYKINDNQNMNIENEQL
jgi:hypothetical protein